MHPLLLIRVRALLKHPVEQAKAHTGITPQEAQKGEQKIKKEGFLTQRTPRASVSASECGGGTSSSSSAHPSILGRRQNPFFLSLFCLFFCFLPSSASSNQVLYSSHRNTTTTIRNRQMGMRFGAKRHGFGRSKRALLVVSPLAGAALGNIGKYWGADTRKRKKKKRKVFGVGW